VRATNVLLIIVGLVACGGRVPRGEPPTSATPWCFSFAYRADGKPRIARACWQDEKICDEAAGLVVKHGRYAKVIRVGECEVVR